MPGIARSTIAGNNRKSNLKIKKKGNKNYEYYFTDMEFITDREKDVIFFNLPDIDLEHGQSKPQHVSIVDYCTTKPAQDAVLSVYPINTGVPRPTPYLRGNKEAAFQVSLEPHEMVFVGVIVEIEEDGNYIHIICDPQVGNGPPSDDPALARDKYRPAMTIL
jgi:hypothetical protein